MLVWWIRYFEAARSFYRRPLLHYNSWFDFFTWQEGDGLDEDIAYLSQFEPFNPLLKKLVERKAKVKDRKMNEESCKDRVVSLGTELHDKRGVQLDSFLWDDGWDNHSSLWDFHRGFPRGFTPVSEVAAKYERHLDLDVIPSVKHAFTVSPCSWVARSVCLPTFTVVGTVQGSGCGCLLGAVMVEPN